MGVQIHVQHARGAFSGCPRCGHQPRHIAHAGPLQGEPIAFQRYPVRHRFECRCGFATPWQRSLVQCEQAWGVKFSQRPLRLQQPERLRQAA